MQQGVLLGTLHLAAPVYLPFRLAPSFIAAVGAPDDPRLFHRPPSRMMVIYPVREVLNTRRSYEPQECCPGGQMQLHGTCACHRGDTCLRVLNSGFSCGRAEAEELGKASCRQSWTAQSSSRQLIPLSISATVEGFCVSGNTDEPHEPGSSDQNGCLATSLPR